MICPMPDFVRPRGTNPRSKATEWWRGEEELHKTLHAFWPLDCRKASRVETDSDMEPPSRIELLTCALRMRRSTN